MTIPAALRDTDQAVRLANEYIADVRRAGLEIDAHLLHSDIDAVTTATCRRLARVDGLVWC